ncbi:MAG TPA: hypothetical protein VFQ88_13205 [Nevskiaceae bacterium]|nr:hypothetical protein [Nevskiaceae bacterium]
MRGGDDLSIDPWVCSTRADRLILRTAGPLCLQLDLFDQQPGTDVALRWLGLVLRAVNLALPVLARKTGTCLAPLPVQDLVDYVREDRWPEPTDATTLVPDQAGKLLWPAGSRGQSTACSLRGEPTAHLYAPARDRRLRNSAPATHTAQPRHAANRPCRDVTDAKALQVLVPKAGSMRRLDAEMVGRLPHRARSACRTAGTYGAANHSTH